MEKSKNEPTNEEWEAFTPQQKIEHHKKMMATYPPKHLQAKRIEEEVKRLKEKVKK